jgi:hypothetical protein
LQDWRSCWQTGSGENGEVKQTDASDPNATKETTMYVNPESFLALGGNAAAVSRLARRLSDEVATPRGVWREAPEEVAPVNLSTLDRYRSVFTWTGDRLIAVGTWLKTQSGPTTYQHA